MNPSGCWKLWLECQMPMELELHIGRKWDFELDLHIENVIENDFEDYNGI